MSKVLHEFKYPDHLRLVVTEEGFFLMDDADDTILIDSSLIGTRECGWVAEFQVPSSRMRYIHYSDVRLNIGIGLRRTEGECI